MFALGQMCFLFIMQDNGCNLAEVEIVTSRLHTDRISGEFAFDVKLVKVCKLPIDQ